MTQFKKYGFYDYQVEAAETTELNKQGIIVMPTGTGKTFVQAGIIANDIKNNPGFRMYIVNAPRIMLSFQLLEEVFKFNVNNGIDARYMAVHSGGMDQKDLDKFRSQTEIEYSKIESTTSPGGIADMITKCRESNQPLIFFSTYNSMIRIDQGKAFVGDPYINIVLNDEAHYLIQERFNSDFNEIETHRKYFFTATTRHTPSDEGLGMNNRDFYGDVLYKMSPKKAILEGKMVRPRIHIVSESEGENSYTPEDLDKNLGKIVKNSFEEHEGLITPHQIPKVLVSSRGVKDIKNLINSREIQNLKSRGVKIYAVASDEEVSNYINGEKVKRKEFLQRLKMDGKNMYQKLIVIHYDILTEGIDVPGLTGALFLRDLTKSKFVQTTGRISRLDPEDRAKIQNKEITPLEIKKFKKPYAWAIIPEIMTSDIDKLSNLIGFIDAMRESDYDDSELVETIVNPRGIGDDDPTDIVPRNRNNNTSGEIIDYLKHTIESEKIANMSFEDFLGDDDNIFSSL